MRSQIILASSQKPIRFAIREYFRKHGFRLDCSVSLTEARPMVEMARYQLLIADLPLQSDSADFGSLGELHRQFPDMRILALSTQDPVRMTQRGRDFGVDAVLEKPLQLTEIVNVAAALLGRKGRKTRLARRSAQEPNIGQANEKNSISGR